MYETPYHRLRGDEFWCIALVSFPAIIVGGDEIMKRLFINRASYLLSFDFSYSWDYYLIVIQLQLLHAHLIVNCIT